MEVTIIRKVELSMDEQKKYEVIKSLADHPAPNKQRAALTLGCTVRHINRMLKGYKEHGKAYFIHGNIQRINPCIYDNSIQFLFHHSTLYQIVIQTF